MLRTLAEDGGSRWVKIIGCCETAGRNVDPTEDEKKMLRKMWNLRDFEKEICLHRILWRLEEGRRCVSHNPILAFPYKNTNVFGYNCATKLCPR
jgi:hypothetical protein